MTTLTTSIVIGMACMINLITTLLTSPIMTIFMTHTSIHIMTSTQAHTTTLIMSYHLNLAMVSTIHTRNTMICYHMTCITPTRNTTT